MTTSAEKRPRTGKVHKEPKIEVSTFFSQYLIKKKGKGQLENTLHITENLCTALQKNLHPSNTGFSNKWVKELGTESCSPPPSTNDWQNNPDVAGRSRGMKSWGCTDPSKMSWQLSEQHSTRWLPPNSQNSTAYNGVLGYYWRIMWQIEMKRNKTPKKPTPRPTKQNIWLMVMIGKPTAD